MRGFIFKVWQGIGDAVLGAAGRGARLVDRSSEEIGTKGPEGARPVVPGHRIRPAFEVIAGGKGTGLPADGASFTLPKRPAVPSRRAS